MSWQALVIYAAGAFALWAIVTTLAGYLDPPAQPRKVDRDDRI